MGRVWPHANCIVYYRIWWALLLQDMEQLSDVVLGAVWPHAYSTVYYRIWWALFGLMPIALYIIGYGGRCLASCL